MRVFKENIKRLYPIDYVEIISNLRPESINENFLIYEEVIIEIINSFEKFKDSLHIENLTQIAQIFLQLKQNEIIVKFIRNIFQVNNK